MKRPNFFIIGAPKCGTTSLAHWLSGHPQVFMSPVKEPHFHNTDMRHRLIRSRNDYDALFRGASERHQAVGEASVWYLYSREAVRNILADTPGARLIVCVRNPVEMVVSLHNQHVIALFEHVTRFEDAWSAQSERRQERNLGSYCDEPSLLLYGPACALGTQLAALFGVAQRDNVRVIFLDDLRRDPRREYLETLEFLGLPDDGRRDFAAVNRASALRSLGLRKFLWHAGRIKQRLGLPLFNTGVMQWLLAMNKRQKQSNEVDPAFMKREVIPYFSAEIALLERLTGRNFPQWRG